jgi:hypothetical protein
LERFGDELVLGGNVFRELHSVALKIDFFASLEICQGYQNIVCGVNLQIFV